MKEEVKKSAQTTSNLQKLINHDSHVIMQRLNNLTQKSSSQNENKPASHSFAASREVDTFGRPSFTSAEKLKDTRSLHDSGPAIISSGAPTTPIARQQSEQLIESYVLATD